MSRLLAPVSDVYESASILPIPTGAMVAALDTDAATASIRKSWKDGRTPRKDGDAVHGNPATYGNAFHADPRDVLKARAVIEDAVRNGGATYTRDYQHVTIPAETPYIIGGVVPSVEIVTITDADTMDALALRLHRFIVQSGKLYGVECYAGVWFECGAYGDRWTFDLVTLHGADDWQRVADERNQRAVYNALTDETLYR